MGVVSAGLGKRNTIQHNKIGGLTGTLAETNEKNRENSSSRKPEEKEVGGKRKRKQRHRVGPYSKRARCGAAILRRWVARRGTATAAGAGACTLASTW